MARRTTRIKSFDPKSVVRQSEKSLDPSSVTRQSERGRRIAIVKQPKIRTSAPLPRRGRKFPKLQTQLRALTKPRLGRAIASGARRILKSKPSPSPAPRRGRNIAAPLRPNQSFPVNQSFPKISRQLKATRKLGRKI